MPYREDLDVLVFSKSIEIDITRLTVSVYSYNNGPKKLQISRENRDKKGIYHHVRLGRISKDELEKILPIINEAKEVM